MGPVVLMGVGLTELTLIHLAEQLAGRNLFRRWATRLRWAADGSRGGGLLPGLRQVRAGPSVPIRQSTIVGQSRWHVYPAQEMLERTAQTIRNEPTMTHCGRADCNRCNDAVLGGPILTLSPPMIG